MNRGCIKDKKLRELSKEVEVEWSYPAIPKPTYACRMRHKASGSYIHTNSKSQKDGFISALELISKQIEKKK